jgi:hypothetical protein
MDNVVMFYDHLKYFSVICYILWTFGIGRGNLAYFSPFWYFVPREIWQPCSQSKDLETTLIGAEKSERNSKHFQSKKNKKIDSRASLLLTLLAYRSGCPLYCGKLL